MATLSVCFRFRSNSDGAHYDVIPGSDVEALYAAADRRGVDASTFMRDPILAAIKEP